VFLTFYDFVEFQFAEEESDKKYLLHDIFCPIFHCSKSFFNEPFLTIFWEISLKSMDYRSFSFSMKNWQKNCS